MFNSRRKRGGRLRNNAGIAATSLVAAATIGGIAVFPASVAAQTPSPLGEWQYSAGVPLQKLFNPAVPAWQISVGAAMTLQPRYAGSDRYRVMGGPNFDVRYRDLFFLSTGEGLGANVLRGPNWRAYWFGCFVAGVGVITKGVGILALLMLAPYAFESRAIRIGHANRRDWWLLDVGAIVPGCAPAADAGRRAG